LAPLLRSNVTPTTFLSDANNEAMVRQLHGYARCHDFLGALCVRMHSSFFDWIQALGIIFPVPNYLVETCAENLTENFHSITKGTLIANVWLNCLPPISLLARKLP
jgi:hypothetical protein